MSNPNGPYPGRQLFVGMTAAGNPALVYLVTGRSPQSRERQATTRENGIIIGPIGDQPYDPLRHYTAVKYDNGTGLAAVSNGIQTEAIFEAYRLLKNVDAPFTGQFLEMLLEGARAEPDSLNTPRIAGMVIRDGSGNPVFFIGLKRHDQPATVFPVTPEPGSFRGVSTYQGELDNPVSFDPAAGPAQLKFQGKTAPELSRELFDLSAAEHNGDDIRVCTVGGVFTDRWDLATLNRVS